MKARLRESINVIRVARRDEYAVVVLSQGPNQRLGPGVFLDSSGPNRQLGPLGEN